MGTRVLIVDDQPGILLLFTDILEAEGHHVTTAKTGHEALDMIRTHMYDLVILDYQLPIVNGREVVKQLEKEHITVPIIIMSGLTEQIPDNIKDHDQVVSILAKPFDVTGASELVKESIENYDY